MSSENLPYPKAEAGQIDPLQPLDLNTLQKRLTVLYQKDYGNRKARQEFLEIALSLVNGAAAVLFSDDNGALKAETTLISRQAEHWSPDLSSVMQDVAVAAIREEKSLVRDITLLDEVQAIAIPIFGEAGADCLVVTIMAGELPVQVFVAVLQLLCSGVSLWRKKQIDRLSGAGFASPQLLEVCGRAIVAGDKDRIGSEIAVGLKEFFGAEKVFVATATTESEMNLLAVSTLVDHNSQSDILRKIQQVVNEIALYKQVMCWPDAVVEGALLSPVVRELGRNMDAGRVVVLPVMSGDTILAGALVLSWNEKNEYQPERLREFTSYNYLFASLLQKIATDNTSWYHRVKKLGAGKRLIGLAFGLILLGTIFLPAPFRVEGECRLEPKIIRYVVAYFDGILDEVYGEPGEEVARDDVLARLDGRSIELEIGSLEAEIKKNRKLQDVHMVSGQAASTQLAVLEGKRLQEKRKLLENRLQRLQMVSPVDGVIISESLQDSEGSPVRKGQSLFEVAPLDKMVVTVNISQQDISYIKVGADMTILFESYPGREWHGEVNSVSPRAQLYSGTFVFIVRTELVNNEGLLRPGMKGDVKIEAGSKPLWWVWFRTPWNYLLKIVSF